MVKRLGKMIAPVVRRLFPDVPREHPAFSSIVMNISANLLGLGNAATPFGLKAMEHLQALNSDKLSASPAMITLLVMNTSCITFIPSMVISLRVAAGSTNPTIIIGATFLSSLIGLSFALVADRLLRRHYFRR
jgi:spore maturation protein A